MGDLGKGWDGEWAEPVSGERCILAAVHLTPIVLC